MAYYWVTGAAGFIGWKVAELLLADGQAVVGMDNLNDACDVRLKHWRLAQLEGHPGLKFRCLDIGNDPLVLFDLRSCSGASYYRTEADGVVRDTTEQVY